MFDSIINESSRKYGLGDRDAGNLLSSLLSLITDQSQGGFAGFLNRFRQIGLEDAVNSWVGSNSNVTLSGEQVESALGVETTDAMARQAGGLDTKTTRRALGQMIPRVVDLLTPDGVVPTENDLLSRIGGFLSGVGGGVVSTTGVMMSDSLDRSGTAAAEDINRTTAAGENLTEAEFNDDSPLKWLLPLVIFFLLLVVGYAFCGGKKVEAAQQGAVINLLTKSAANS